MLASLKKRAFETVRCSRHNLLHLKMFKIDFDGARWRVEDRHGYRAAYPFYPYNAVYQTEGYLRQGAWPLQPGMVVIDGGGCYGEFAMYAARQVGPTGRVLMLEPDVENVRRAEEVFAMQGGRPANLEIVQAGLWKSAGTIRFAAGLGEMSYVLEEGQAVPAGAHVIEIPVESLQSLVEKFGLTRMDLVKLDIEGAEIEVVESSAALMATMAPRFAIASYHLRDGKQTAELLEPMFRRMGYAAETGFPDHKTTWAARGTLE